MRQRRCLLDIAHHTAGNSGGAHSRFPIRRAAHAQHFGEHRLQGLRIGAPQVGCLEARILDPFGAPQQARQRFELTLLYDPQGNLLAVGGLEQRGSGLAAVTGIAGPFQGSAGDQERHHGGSHECEAGVHHRDIDVFTLAAPLAPEKRRQDRERRRLTGEGVDDRETDAHRWIPRIAPERHHAARGLHDVVDRGPVAQRARLAVPRNGTVNDVFSHGTGLGVPEAEARHDARSKILDDDVRARDEPFCRLHRYGILEIQRNRLLARVDRDERRRHAVVSTIGAVVAHGVAAPRRFYLDDFRAEQAQKMRGIGTGHDVAEIRDPNPLKWLHLASPYRSLFPFDQYLLRSVAHRETRRYHRCRNSPENGHCVRRLRRRDHRSVFDLPAAWGGTARRPGGLRLRPIDRRPASPSPTPLPIWGLMPRALHGPAGRAPASVFRSSRATGRRRAAPRVPRSTWRLRRSAWTSAYRWAQRPRRVRPWPNSNRLRPWASTPDRCRDPALRRAVP